MKTMNFSKNLLLLLSGVLALSACEPKNEARWEQEPAKDWSVKSTPDDQEVKAQAFTSFDLTQGFELAREGKGDLTAQILLPLSKIVLNREFIEKPSYRTVRLHQMISIFNAAFVIEYKKTPQSADFTKIKESYFNTVFAGCTRDLERDCINASLFAADGRHTMIMTLLARELDPQIEAQLKVSGSSSKCISDNATCRNLIEERYRRLTMAVYKSNRYQDPDFAFAYLKYARLFSAFLENAKKQIPAKGQNFESMSTSYLAEVHGKIFETVIAKYKPTDINDPEFRAFVENFNPWGYSRRQADLFQYGTGVMFELGTKCCLYQDKAKTQLSKSVRDAINDSQADKDSFGLSFRQIVADIKKEHSNRLFTKLHMNDLIADIERPDSAFYNEYFFIVDRLFRGHLSSSEIDMMLRNTNAQRARTELPKMISAYVKVYLVYMTVETNRFMADIYHSDLASDKIFEQAVVRSRELTSRWYTVQAQIDLLDKLMNSYFKDLLITSPEYNATFNLLRSVNRNIHYISVYPNMIVMNYFLSKMKGSISFDSWWGRVEINADTILKAFFDGDIVSPWFRFGKDTEALDRLMLLYSLEYTLSTETLDSFVAKDAGSKDATATDRSKFFDIIFTKYLGDSVDAMLKELNDYQRNTLGNPNFSYVKDVCNYEMNPAAGAPPSVVLNFLELDRYTYTGLGDNSINKVIEEFLTGSGSSAGTLLDTIEMRRTYVRSMMDVIEGDLLRTGAIKNAGDPHPDLATPRALLKQLDDIQSQLTKLFVSNHKTYFDCAVKLREIERRRANRLYDEERAHLGRIFDEMKPLVGLTDPKDLADKIKEINSRVFTEANGYKFDRVEGLNYRMAKYDLLLRMTKRIEADVFVNPTEKERKFYGASLMNYVRPRAVSVKIPIGVVRNEMYEKEINTAISVHGTGDADREDFIRQGMATLNGKTDAFVRWHDQQENDKSFLSYLSSLEAYYLLPKVEGADQSQEVTAADLTNAYITIVAGETMDAYDVEYAKLFDNYGHHSKDFYFDLLFERDGMTRLPLFYSLMTDTSKMASVDSEKPGPVNEALDFAKRFNSMQAFVFDPSTVVKTSVYNVYGTRAHWRLNRVSELFSYLAAKEASVTDAAQLDQRLTQPIFLENGTLSQWYVRGTKNLVDQQRFQDHRIRIGDFVQRSGNFYGTKEKVKAP